MSAELWNDALRESLPKQALQTSFIQNLKNDSLNPVHYKEYFLQDVVYCQKITENYVITTKKMDALYLKKEASETQKDFMYERTLDYQFYTHKLKEMWKVSESSTIQLSPAVVSYIDFTEQLNLNQHNPFYLLIGSLPCFKLWHWLAHSIKLEIEGNNKYQAWVQENSDGNSLQILENFIDDNAASVNYQKARSIYKEALVRECNFFHAATKSNAILNNAHHQNKEDSWLKKPNPHL